MPRPQAIVIGLILLLLGFGLGRLFTGPPPPLYGPQAGTQSTRPADMPDDVPEDEAERAIRAALALTDGFDRLIALGELLKAAGPSAVPAVMTVMRDGSVRPGAAELELLVRFWAQFEPETAAQWSFQAPMAYRAVVIVPAMEAWAAEDPTSAAKASRTAGVEQGTANQAAQRAMVRGWFASGKPGLVEYMQAMDPGSIEQQRAIAVFAHELVETRGPQVSIDWATSLPDEPRDFKLTAYRQLGSELAMANLDAAKAFCKDVCDEPMGDGVRKRIAQQWAMLDGPAALQWLSEAPPGQERDLAVRVAFFTWRGVDQKGAFAWIAQFGEDGIEPWLRPAVPVYAKVLSAEDPAAAMGWVELIPDDVERQITMVRVARRWRGVDEAAAEAWVQQSPLPKALREAARTTDVEAEIPQPQLLDQE